MPTPAEFPLHFSTKEQAIALTLMAKAEEMAWAYNGDWSAPWLAEHAYASEWTLLMHGSRTRKFDWGITLPNGTLLTDDQHKLMLHAAQSAAFLSRHVLSTKINSSTTLLGFLYQLATLIKWMYINEPILNPSSEAFSQLTTDLLKDFLHEFKAGGVPWVLGYPAALLRRWYENALGGALPEYATVDFFAVPASDKREISQWLKLNGYFREPLGRSKGMLLDRRKIASDMGWDVMTIKSHVRFAAFLRQFEVGISSPLMIGREVRREYPSHRVQTVEEVKCQDYRAPVDGMLFTISSLVRLHRHLPTLLPDSSNIRIAQLRKICAADNQRTPWIPLDVALKYTTEAIRWIHVYGNDLVDTYLEILTQYKKYTKRGQRTAGMHLRWRKKLVGNYELPPSLASLNISDWNSKLINDCENYDEFRSAPGMNDAIAILIGSIFILLSITKPMRESEISSLSGDCIKFRDNDGYWIEQRVAKAGLDDQQPKSLFPIPYITAYALGLVKKLRDGILELFPDSAAGENDTLFLLPNRTLANDVTLSPATPMRLNGFIDKFCDWVNLPPDEFGRRWYIRIHESRKSFLITFFWCFRYGGLEAARWLAGHNDAKHIYTYIQANFPGEELPAIEAEYAVQQLWIHESGGLAEAQNTADLYTSVKDHFGVNSISLISEADIIDWLELSFSDGSYEIEPYSIKTASGVMETIVCFKITPRKSDEHSS